jgi:RNA polymerase-binding transcription factor DksA
MAQTAKKTAAEKAARGARKATKEPATKRAPAKKTATTRAPAEKAATKRAPAEKAATTRAPAKKAAAKKAPAKKAAAEKAATKRAPATKKAGATKAGAKRAGSRRSSSPFPARFLDAQRKALVEERATYLGQAESLQAEADSLIADVDPGDVQFDEESGEGDTLAIERERDLALSAQARQAVEEIDHALAKFDLGTYGICEISGDPIPRERLEAIPWAREKVEYKTGGLGRR